MAGRLLILIALGTVACAIAAVLVLVFRMAGRVLVKPLMRLIGELYGEGKGAEDGNGH